MKTNFKKLKKKMIQIPDLINYELLNTLPTPRK